MSEIVSWSRALITNGGSNTIAPSSIDALYNGLSHIGGESFASRSVIRNETTVDWPFPSSSVAWNIF